jgi:hypothetical protein
MSKINNQLIINLINIFQQNITNNNDNEEITKIETKSSKFLFLMFFDLIIFCALTYTTYNSSKKLNENNENKKTEDFKPNFMKWLVVANGVRSLSIFFIMLFGNPNENNSISWLNSLLHVGPAFLFVSSYMYLATFLADLYYKNIDYNNHLLKPSLSLLVSGGYFILGFLAIITFLFRNYILFYFISEFLMAVLYLILGTIIIYFGRKVSIIIVSKNQGISDEKEMGNKLSILSNSIGFLFILKGISGVLTGGNFLTPSKYPNIYDFFWFLILEICPTVIFIEISKNKESNNNDNENRRESSVYEMELNESLNRDSSYKPPNIY